MGWLRSVGCLKLQVSFPEYRLFCRALLQKKPIILRSLLIVATPYLSQYTKTEQSRETENDHWGLNLRNSKTSSAIHPKPRYVCV